VNDEAEEDEIKRTKRFISIPLGANYKLHAHVVSVTDEKDWGVFGENGVKSVFDSC